MLSSGETAALLAVLGDERSLESHVSAFRITFKRHQHFKACCCLIMLLEVRWSPSMHTLRVVSLEFLVYRLIFVM